LRLFLLLGPLALFDTADANNRGNRENWRDNQRE
jgi:hypothetical protein